MGLSLVLWNSKTFRNDPKLQWEKRLAGEKSKTEWKKSSVRTNLIEAKVDDLGADLSQVCADTQSAVYEGTELFISDSVPHTITGQNQKLICRRALHSRHFRLWRYHLFRDRPPLSCLVTEVPQRSGDCQRAVHTLQSHRSSSALYPLPLAGAEGLVVFRREGHPSCTAQDRPRVPAVHKVDEVWSDSGGNGSRPSAFPTLTAGHGMKVLVHEKEALLDALSDPYYILICSDLSWEGITCH